MVHVNPYGALEQVASSLLVLFLVKSKGLSNFDVMKMVYWNVRGACSPHKKCIFWDTQHTVQASYLIVIEVW